MSASDEKIWQTTAVQNLVKYAPSGTYFARFRVGGKRFNNPATGI
jgi:hypothetical protein